MIIIGSTALKHHFEDYLRKPKDLDIVVRDGSKYQKEEGVEYLSNPILLKYEKGKYISPNMLLTLKLSHMFWDFNWDKHIYDVQFLLNKGCRYDIAILREFRAYWEQVLPKVKRSDLEQGKEEFFTNNVNEDVDQHDYLHTLINPIPMYTKLLKDGCEVELDENKWYNLSFEDKCEVVREETYVMAFERYKRTPYYQAYNRQLKVNIQKHFPEYIALFAIENYIKLEKPKCNYKQIIENGLTAYEF